jgi:SAM-dependent methyltransferase
MYDARQSHARVREHYQRIAPQYAIRANQTCERTYFQLVKRFLAKRHRVLELGSGSTDLLDRLASPIAVACDLSWDMLRAKNTRIPCVVAAGERLPFREHTFDGVFLVNVVEHVADLETVLQESARVLEDDGTWLAITPNGDWEFWLDLAERWSLKIPEGPHTFVRPAHLRKCAQKHFDVIDHRTFLTFPAGPAGFARIVDRLTFSAALGWGFFQYIVGKKRASSQCN